MLNSVAWFMCGLNENILDSHCLCMKILFIIHKIRLSSLPLRRSSKLWCSCYQVLGTSIKLGCLYCLYCLYRKRWVKIFLLSIKMSCLRRFFRVQSVWIFIFLYIIDNEILVAWSVLNKSTEQNICVLSLEKFKTNKRGTFGNIDIGISASLSASASRSALQIVF